MRRIRKKQLAICSHFSYTINGATSAREVGQGRNPAALSDVSCVLFLFIFRVIAIAYLPQRILKMHRYDELIPEKGKSNMEDKVGLAFGVLKSQKTSKNDGGEGFFILGK